MKVGLYIIVYSIYITIFLAVEQACESVKKIQKYVGALLSFDETAQYLNLALKCCQGKIDY